MSAGFHPIVFHSMLQLGKAGPLPDGWRRALIGCAVLMLGVAATLPVDCRNDESAAEEGTLLCSRMPH